MRSNNRVKPLPPVNDLDLSQRGFQFLEKSELTDVYYNPYNSVAWYIHYLDGDNFIIAADETTKYFGPIQDAVVLKVLCQSLAIKKNNE